MAKKAASLDPTLVRKTLLESSNTLDFLQKYFRLRVEILGKPGYSTFSQRAGFSSRSHIRDILIGRVKITNASMVKIAKALGFKDEVSEIFFLKGKIESLEEGNQGTDSLNQIIQFLRYKIEAESSPSSNDERTPFHYRALVTLQRSRYDEFRFALNELLNQFVSNLNDKEKASEKDGTLEIVCEMSLIGSEALVADSNAS